MNDVIGWIWVAAWLITPLFMVGVALHFIFTKKPVEEKYTSSGGGLVGVFDAVWSPSAHQAGIERDRQTKRTAPTPSPGDPPWTIDGDRIRIDV